MTTQYLIALGHDVDLEDLEPLVPQPASAGLFYARRSYAASGIVIDEQPFVEYVYSSLGNRPAVYQALLTQCGLISAKIALVTAYVQDEDYNWIHVNGTIVRPEPGRDGARSGFFLRNFILLLKNVREIAA